MGCEGLSSCTPRECRTVNVGSRACWFLACASNRQQQASKQSIPTTLTWSWSQLLKSELRGRPSCCAEAKKAECSLSLVYLLGTSGEVAGLRGGEDRAGMQRCGEEGRSCC